MDIIRFNLGDVLVLKKNHPCGNNKFKVQRCGSDVKIQCVECGRSLELARPALEKSIKKVLPAGGAEL